MESILTSIKKLLGITAECVDFDVDIVMHINSTFAILNQLGVGTEGFTIRDEYETWDQFVSESEYEPVKTYVYMKVKLMFDPPLSSAVMECMKQSISEFEWRLNFAAELKQSSGEEESQNG